MVDFTQFGKKGKREVPINPVDIFLTIIREGLNDLYLSQSEVLKTWFEKRTIKDSIIKLHTGGGKTLVGLLIAKSIMNEVKGPVLYLVPNNQLKMQVLQRAEEYGIEAEVFDDDYNFSDRFYDGEAVLIATYARLFNGFSKFGIIGGDRQIVNLKGVIVDDAHIAPSQIRDYFTIKIPNSSEVFRRIRELFRIDFDQIGKIATFEDMSIGRDNSILEVPYWAVENKLKELRSIIGEVSRNMFQWPLIRDNLKNCHIFVTSQNITITPISLDVDQFPSFSDCPRRIYMSATINDHGDIVRAFDLRENKLQLLSTKTVAGIGEKMIIVPDLVCSQDSLEITKKISLYLTQNPGTIAVITPSKNTAMKRWGDFGEIVTGEDVDERVVNMLKLESKKPTIFVNRYDGMNLKGKTCRVLILDGLPKETSEYDRYRAIVTSGGDLKALIIASRIEQGIGRSSRGSGDYSVVFLIGNELTNWITQRRNTALLTVSTRAQLTAGTEISKTLNNEKEILDFALQCLERNKKWIEFHNEQVVDAIENDSNYFMITLSYLERKYYNLIKEGKYHEACALLTPDPKDRENLDKWMLGWLKQLAARAAFYAGEIETSKRLQEQAYNLNKNLFRPKELESYVPLDNPVSQCATLKKRIQELTDPRGLVTQYDSCVVEIDMNLQSAHQFEQSLSDLGIYFGFVTERPDNDYGKGPDVLWISENKEAFIIEAKNSKKQKGSAFNKEENGQLLSSIEWFKKNYPSYSFVPIVMLPENLVTKNAELNPNTRVVDPQTLLSIISAGRELISKFTGSLSSDKNDQSCHKLIQDLQLNFKGIIEKFTNIPIVVK